MYKIAFKWKNVRLQSSFYIYIYISFCKKLKMYLLVACIEFTPSIYYMVLKTPELGNWINGAVLGKFSICVYTNSIWSFSAIPSHF